MNNTVTVSSSSNNNVCDELNTSQWQIFRDELAKKALLKLLENLKKGHLRLEDHNEVFLFGEPADQAGICACIRIHTPTAYKHIIRGGSIGAAESYILDEWSSPDLLNVIRLMALNLSTAKELSQQGFWLKRIQNKVLHRLNRNSSKGSSRNISAHYDLGNDFFSLFLDPTMMYSSAIYADASTSLEDASVYKLDTICKKLRLNEQDHLLEIGTGWGGLAVHAAKNYGCKVTTTTISKEQYEYAKASVHKEGLDEKVTVLLKDYRDLEGQYDKLVSIEMIEAVGHEFYKSYFQQASRLLKPNGLMLIQAITITDQRFEAAKRSVDFIQRYIFPGGCLPSNEVIARCVSHYTDMMIVNHHDIGIDYAKTLCDWRRRFQHKLDAVKQMGFDDQFCRMWEYYLCYCEGGFLERAISCAQIVMAKPGARQIDPLT